MYNVVKQTNLSSHITVSRIATCFTVEILFSHPFPSINFHYDLNLEIFSNESHK